MIYPVDSAIQLLNNWGLGTRYRCVAIRQEDSFQLPTLRKSKKAAKFLNFIFNTTLPRRKTPSSTNVKHWSRQKFKFTFLFLFAQLHVLSRALISTFQETIPAAWLPEVAAAWELLLNYFTIMLKEGIRSGSSRSSIVWHTAKTWKQHATSVMVWLGELQSRIFLQIAYI